MGHVRELLFDFNGTLSDDEPVLLSIDQRLSARHGAPVTAEDPFGGLAGLSDEVLIGNWLGVDRPLLESLVAERVAADAAEAAAFEDTEAGVAVASAKDAGVHCLAVRGTLLDERLARADELVDGIDVALVRRLLACSARR
jgi:beta-phosphoglucomutase-like phosphatase (HAD superfamily)